MIETFVNYMRLNRGLAASTCKAYEEDLRDFASFVNDRFPSTRWSNVTKQMIDEYVVMMVAEEKSPATIKRHVSALRTFYKTCQAMGAKVENVARFVSTPRLADLMPKTIEVDAIKAALESDTVGSTAKAVIAIIFETGLRLQELLDLRAQDIDSKSQSIRVVGKGGKERTVYYGELTKRYGCKWHSEGMTQRRVRHLVYEALRPYSKAEQLSPHALRHTYASELLNNGMSLEAVGKLMGHQHTETTEVYARLRNNTTRNLYLQFAPSV